MTSLLFSRTGVLKMENPTGNAPNAPKKHDLVLASILMVVPSFSPGMEVQRQIAAASSDRETFAGIAVMRRGISNILRSIDNGVMPAAHDAVILRDHLSNIGGALPSEGSGSAAEYPYSVNYPQDFNNKLPGNTDVADRVQQIGSTLFTTVMTAIMSSFGFFS